MAMVSVSSINYKYPTLEYLDSNKEYGDACSKNYNIKPVSKFIAKRNKAETRSVSREDKVKAAVGAIVGTAIPMIMMMNKQKVKNPFRLKYGLTEMVAMAGGTVVGGVAVGMIGEDRETKKNKLKEGVFQFLNASVPAWVVAGSIKLCESSKNFNNIAGKTMAMLGGLLIGMYGAASVSNAICDPKDKLPDRKLTLIDCMVNIDDALGVLVLAKFPFVEKLHLEKILPAIYTYCGYRAGKSN